MMLVLHVYVDNCEIITWLIVMIATCGGVLKVWNDCFILVVCYVCLWCGVRSEILGDVVMDYWRCYFWYLFKTKRECSNGTFIFIFFLFVAEEECPKGK